MDRALSILRKRWGKVPLRRATLSATDFGPVRGGRRCEVAMAIRRPSGRILLQTKSFYPPLTYRLPTGGIKEGEDVEHALLREVHEETNLSVEVERPVAVIDHVAAGGRVAFRSYLFLLMETGGEFRVNDPKERISGWEDCDIAGLERAIGQLRGLRGEWEHWGRFRAVPLDVLVRAIG